MIEIIALDEIEVTLARQWIGRIACAANDRPYVVPIAYAFEQGCVYAYSTLGRKISVMRKQPLVCFEVEAIEGPSRWRSVIAEAVYEELTEAAGRQRALALIARADGVVPPAANAHDGIVVFRLRLTETSGRFERHDA